MKNPLYRIISGALCLVLLFSSLGVSALAASAETAEGSTDEGKPLPTVEPMAITQAQKDYINAGIVMKVGSDNMLNSGSKQTIFTSANGTAFGKPIKHNGTVYVPLAVPAGYAGGTVEAREDGISFTVRLSNKSYAITVLNERVAAGGGTVVLDHMPIFNSSSDGTEFYPLIALDDVKKLFPNICIFYDEMGLIIFTSSPISLDRLNSTDLTYMLTLMRSFVFDFISGEAYYDSVSENTDEFSHPYIYADQDQFDFIHDVYTGAATDEVYKKWLDAKVDYVKRNYFDYYTTLPLIPAITDDPDDYDFTKKPEYYQLLAFELTNYLHCGIKDGKWVNYKDFDYGQFPVVVNGLKSQPEGYVGRHWNGGYEWSTGRCSESATYAEDIFELALVYQITREEKYAILAWEMTESLMKWDHWAQGHFLNCAVTANHIGCSYDWLYNVWNDLGYDTNKVAQAIYEKCVFYGYITSINLDDPSDYPSSFTGNYYFDEDTYNRPSTYGTTEYNRQSINWNAVCTSGLVVGMMAIIGAEDKNGKDMISTGTEVDFTYTNGHGIIKHGTDPLTKKAHTHTEGMNVLYWLLESNLRTLAEYGIKQYAPDGSFVEGPGYWSYATNNLAKMLWAIDSASGSDRGWHDFWGIDQTFYFAVQTEYPDDSRPAKYSYWAFHDTSYNSQSTFMFFFAADMLEDDSLATIRLEQLSNGKSVSSYDILGYKERYLELSMDNVSLDRDYVMLAMNGVTTRSSWERGCIFTGLIGNNNNDTAHGQTDSGAFTYAASNYTWFVDMGADNYDVHGYFSTSATPSKTYRHLYYRNCAEGANTLCLTSRPDDIPGGQNFTGGYILMNDKLQSEDNGMVAIQNGVTAFGSYAKSAYRGLMTTNDRQTVVIQDQVEFKQAESVCWVAHTKVLKNDIIISADGRTAYLKAKVGNDYYYTRATIVSSDTTLKFQLMDAGINDYLLEKTHRAGWSEENGAEAEYSRLGYYRLVIKAENTLSFNCAVVIEEVDGYNSTEAVGYTWSDMFSWDANTVYKEPKAPAPEVTPDDGIKIGVIQSAGKKALQFIEANYAFTTRMNDFYKTLCEVYNALEIYPPESFTNKAAIKDGYNKYLYSKACWDEYIGFVNRHASVGRSFARKTVLS